MRAVIGNKAGQKVTWNRLVTNGGGLLPGLSIADDGTKTCYTDTAGGYVYDDNASTWKQIASFIQNHNSNQYEWVGYRGMSGMADCQIAPSNSNYIYYLMCDVWYNNRSGRAFLSKSTDKGVTSNITTYPFNTQADANGELIFFTNNTTYKYSQCKIGIDPINENVVYVSNPGGQAKVTFDAGSTFSNVPNLPVGTTTGIGAVCFQFDRSSGTSTVNGQTVTSKIYCAVEGSGSWLSTDGGVSFSQISSIVGLLRPNYCSISADGVYYLSDIRSISFSGTGGTGGVSSTTLTISGVNSGTLYPGAPITGSGVTSGSYIVKQATGTPGGAGTYTLSTASTISNGTTISVASATYSVLNRYQSNAWSVIWQSQLPLSSPLRSRISVAAHPTTNGTVVVVNSGGTPHFLASSDYGDNWTRTNKASENVAASTDSPWYTTAIADPLIIYATQQCFFNRSDGKLYLNYGQGMVRSDITVGVVPTWEAFNVGIEQTVAYGTFHETGTKVLQVVNDIFGFQHDNPSGLQTPPTLPISSSNNLIHGFSGGIDPYNPQNQFVQGYNALSGASAWYYTTNGGTTWNLMANTPPGGIWQGTYASTTTAIANGVILWAPGYASASGGPAYMYRTTDFGATAWVAIDHSAISNGTDFPATGGQGWGFGSLIPRNVICFDQANPNKAYAFNFIFQTPAIKGVYISTDAGVTWTYKGTASDPNSSNATGFYYMKAAPGVEGTVFASIGYNATQPPPSTLTGASLYKTTDGFATPATPLTRVKEVLYMGFGKAGPSGLPTLYISGWVDRNYGIHMSPDLGTTWVQLVSDVYGPWPMHNDAVYGIDGDKDVYGRCYVSFRGSGSAYSTLA